MTTSWARVAGTSQTFGVNCGVTCRQIENDPIALGIGKRVFPTTGVDRRYKLAQTTPYPTGIVGLRYTRVS